MSLLKDAGFTCYSVLAAGGLYLFEHALTHETCFSVLVAAWVTVSVMNHVSAQKRPQEPINKPYAIAKPRMFMFKRMLRAALLAVPLFLDVFTSSTDEMLLLKPACATSSWPKTCALRWRIPRVFVLFFNETSC